MPPLRKPRLDPTIYLGIDPGVNGGLAAIRPDMPGPPVLQKMPDTELELWEWISEYAYERQGPVRAIIEQQTARPSRFYNKKLNVWQNTILASTVTLVGSYMQLRGMLVAANIPDYDDCPPKRWQAAFDLYKSKDETDNKWKNRLKAKAQELYPATGKGLGLTITLATADALLLAEYLKRKTEGRL